MLGLQDGGGTLKADDPLCLIIKGENEWSELLTQGAFANWLITFFAGFVRCYFQANLLSDGDILRGFDCVQFYVSHRFYHKTLQNL
jgi:hypothetical protein